jgi:hypothetical protein
LRLFLQINIADWKETGYSSPLLSFASSLADDIVGTDLDCQSEPIVTELVTKLIDEAERVFVLIVADNATLPLGSALKVLNHLLRGKEKIHLALLSGDHDIAEKMLKPLQVNFKKQDDDGLIRKLIKQFAYC